MIFKDKSWKDWCRRIQNRPPKKRKRENKKTRMGKLRMAEWNKMSIDKQHPFRVIIPPPKSPPLWIDSTEYTQMCKDLDKTIFTAEEYKEWKTKPKLCPNCNSRLKSISSDSCDLCGWEKEKKEKKEKEEKKEYMDRPSDYRTCRNCGHKTKIDNMYCSHYKRPSVVSYPTEKEKRSRTIPKHVQREVWRNDAWSI